jgi:hypothetical protein
VIRRAARKPPSGPAQRASSSSLLVFETLSIRPPQLLKACGTTTPAAPQRRSARSSGRLSLLGFPHWGWPTWGFALRFVTLSRSPCGPLAAWGPGPVGFATRRFGNVPDQGLGCMRLRSSPFLAAVLGCQDLASEPWVAPCALVPLRPLFLPAATLLARRSTCGRCAGRRRDNGVSDGIFLTG